MRRLALCLALALAACSPPTPEEVRDREYTSACVEEGYRMFAVRTGGGHDPVDYSVVPDEDCR